MNNKTVDINISLKNYYDLKLSNNDISLINCDIYTGYDLISSFNFHGNNFLISGVRWDGYSLDEDICDPLHEDNNGYFTLTQITGDTFCYEIDGNNFNGGFYQGYFKTEGYGYQVLPDAYLDGVSFEFWLKPSSGDVITCNDKLSLNEFNENNKGFFFYYGLKEETPYCGKIVAGETCEGIPFIADYEDKTIYPWQTGNTFLYYTEANYCNPPAYEQIFTYPDCCEGIVCNSLGVRLTDEGAFNVRYVGTSGECINNEYISEKVLFDYYSMTGLTSNTEWNHVVLKFSQIISTDECDKYREAQKMLLSIWVDGKNVYEIKVPELKPYGLNVHRSLQVGIPYNISVGGGTLGNLENGYLNNDIKTEEGCSYSLCYSKDNEAKFLGYYIGETFFESDLELNETLETKLLELFDGEVIVNETKRSENCTTYKITINTSKNLTSVKIGDEVINVNKDFCYKIIVNPACNHLAEYFAGSFEGQIDKFNIYDKALKVQEIRCLYDITRHNYNKSDIICCF